MVLRLSLFLLLGVALSSCAKLGLPGITDTPEKEPPSPFGSSGIPPQLRSRTSEAGTPVAAGGNSSAGKFPLNITPDEDIVFTDPDNPNAEIPELSTLLETAKRGPWEASETIAKQRAIREGKPLLIWFTDSASSPMCKALSQELFATQEFGAWADEKLIRLRVDANLQADDPDLSLDEKQTRLIEMKHYVAALKKRYKILGHPSLVLLNPSGEVVGRYRGYKRGDADYFWGLIKHGEAVSAEAYKGWRKKLEDKGYREWSDRRGRKIFARLISYSKGTLILIEPDGIRAQTKESSLSDTDRAWIAEQKKIRNM
ncbi:MAG: thioredoxin family protein [Akkermansiaceae bacterium]